MQSWMGERMAEEHRRDLAASTRRDRRGKRNATTRPSWRTAVTALGDQVVAREAWNEGPSSGCRSLLRWERC